MVHPRQLLKDHGLFATKRRGQNYLIHEATARAIAGAAGIQPGDTVVEIGSGLGALTLALAPLAERVIAIEVDRGIFKVLQSILAGAGEAAANVDARLTDALDLGWNRLADEAGSPLRVVGNLPYSISSPLIFELLAAGSAWKTATLLLQREMVTRLAAEPGSRDYGRLSVLASTWCEVIPGMVLSPEQFFPRPRVDSQLVTLAPRPMDETGVAAEERQWFQQVVKAAFSQRRKTLANSVSAGLRMDRAKAAEALEVAGVDPRRRAETLTRQEFAAMARALERITHTS